MSDANTVSVSLMGKEYMIACPAGAEDQLLQAARQLDEKMKDIRGASKTVGLERIAILAALHISHELLQHNNQQDEHTALAQRQTEMEQQLEKLNRRLDSTLKKRPAASE